jgi:hypothetical protein
MVTTEDGVEGFKASGALFPLRWTAPEAMLTMKFTAASDMWAYGIVLIEVLEDGATPYANLPNADVMRKVPAGYRTLQPKGCPDEVYQLLVDGCWNEDPIERVSFATLVEALEKLEMNLDMTAQNVWKVPGSGDEFELTMMEEEEEEMDDSDNSNCKTCGQTLPGEGDFNAYTTEDEVALQIKLKELAAELVLAESQLEAATTEAELAASEQKTAALEADAAAAKLQAEEAAAKREADLVASDLETATFEADEGASKLLADEAAAKLEADAAAEMAVEALNRKAAELANQLTKASAKEKADALAQSAAEATVQKVTDTIEHANAIGRRRSSTHQGMTAATLSSLGRKTGLAEAELAKVQQQHAAAIVKYEAIANELDLIKQEQQALKDPSKQFYRKQQPQNKQSEFYSNLGQMSTEYVEPVHASLLEPPRLPASSAYVCVHNARAIVEAAYEKAKVAKEAFGQLEANRQLLDAVAAQKVKAAQDKAQAAVDAINQLETNRQQEDSTAAQKVELAKGKAKVAAEAIDRLQANHRLVRDVAAHNPKFGARDVRQKQMMWVKDQAGYIIPCNGPASSGPTESQYVPLANQGVKPGQQQPLYAAVPTTATPTPVESQYVTLEQSKAAAEAAASAQPLYAAAPTTGRQQPLYAAVPTTTATLTPVESQYVTLEQSKAAAEAAASAQPLYTAAPTTAPATSAENVLPVATGCLEPWQTSTGGVTTKANFPTKFSMTFAARNCDAKDMNGSSDPYILFERTEAHLGSGRNATKIYKSEVVKKELNPTWKAFTLTIADFCGSDRTDAVETPVEVTVMDWDRFKSNDLIGTITINLVQILSLLNPASAGTSLPLTWPLINPNRQSGKKADKGYENSGELILVDFVVHETAPLDPNPEGGPVASGRMTTLGIESSDSETEEGEVTDGATVVQRSSPSIPTGIGHTFTTDNAVAVLGGGNVVKHIENLESDEEEMEDAAIEDLPGSPAERASQLRQPHSQGGRGGGSFLRKSALGTNGTEV